ncbi:hypothetical protein [Marinobacter halodurans]|uniref:hypothetical protein n=1 Tax=Marinobacter halodurans TaxID=2528979 RepID=UPI0013F156A8|nr:hypothetical protein [Marinobacter halodurans]
MNTTVSKALFRPQLITSAMDTDAYKLHMQQVVFEKYAAVLVRYEFRCRTDENLAEFAGEIREAINNLEGVAFTEDQLRYLSRIPFLKEAYIEFLRQFRFDPRRYVTVRVDNGELLIRAEGPWLYTILFEIPVLSIVSEIRNRHRYGMVNEDVFREELGMTASDIEETRYEAYALPALTATRGRVVFAYGCEQTEDQALEPDEDVSIHRTVTLDQLLISLANGEINDAESCMALQAYALATMPRL